MYYTLYKGGGGGHRGRVATLSPPTSEIGVRIPNRPQVGKLVAACHWSAVYSTEPWHQLYVLVSSAHKTTCHDMTYTVLKVTSKPKNIYNSDADQTEHILIHKDHSGTKPQSFVSSSRGTSMRNFLSGQNYSVPFVKKSVQDMTKHMKDWLKYTTDKL